MAHVTPPPGVNQTNAKAYIAAGIAFLGAFLSTLLTVWTDTDPLTSRDFVVALSAAIVTGGVTGGVTYQTTNRSVPPTQAGAIDVGTAVVIAILVLLVLLVLGVVDVAG